MLVVGDGISRSGVDFITIKASPEIVVPDVTGLIRAEASNYLETADSSTATFRMIFIRT